MRTPQIYQPRNLRQAFLSLAKSPHDFLRQPREVFRIMQTSVYRLNSEVPKISVDEWQAKLSFLWDPQTALSAHVLRGFLIQLDEICLTLPYSPVLQLMHGVVKHQHSVLDALDTQTISAKLVNSCREMTNSEFCVLIRVLSRQKALANPRVLHKILPEWVSRLPKFTQAELADLSIPFSRFVAHHPHFFTPKYSRAEALIQAEKAEDETHPELIPMRERNQENLLAVRSHLVAQLEDYSLRTRISLLVMGAEGVQLPSIQELTLAEIPQFPSALLKTGYGDLEVMAYVRKCREHLNNLPMLEVFRSLNRLSLKKGSSGLLLLVQTLQDEWSTLDEDFQWSLLKNLMRMPALKSSKKTTELSTLVDRMMVHLLAKTEDASVFLALLRVPSDDSQTTFLRERAARLPVTPDNLVDLLRIHHLLGQRPDLAILSLLDKQASQLCDESLVHLARIPGLHKAVNTRVKVSEGDLLTPKISKACLVKVQALLLEQSLNFVDFELLDCLSRVSHLILDGAEDIIRFDGHAAKFLQAVYLISPLSLATTLEVSSQLLKHTPLRSPLRSTTIGLLSQACDLVGQGALKVRPRFVTPQLFKGLPHNSAGEYVKKLLRRETDQ